MFKFPVTVFKSSGFETADWKAKLLFDFFLIEPFLDFVRFLIKSVKRTSLLHYKM